MRRLRRTWIIRLAGLLCCWYPLVSTGFPADWKSEANRWIEQLRKRELRIVVVDRAGRPFPKASIRLRQTRQGFPFGAAMTGRLLRNEKAQAFFKEHFNWATFGNESKWYANEHQEGVEDYTTADALLAWCQENQIPVRGHCLFWEPEKWQMSWLKPLTGDALRAAVERRLEHAVAHFRGRFVHWDVDNELLHGSFFKDRLGEAVWPWMFQRVRELDPDVKLFVNEFNILSVDQNFQAVETDAYVDQIRWLLSQGAPIDGVGVQGHIWADPILDHPEKIRERLDQLALLGLPIWITEFDTADVDEASNADKLELVYRTAFGHPAVEGIVMWSYWAGSAWRGPHSGIAREDWTLNRAGERYEALLEEWRTGAEGQTDQEGVFQMRAFLGEYEVSVEASGQTVRRSFRLDKGDGVAQVRVEAGPIVH